MEFESPPAAAEGLTALANELPGNLEGCRSVEVATLATSRCEGPGRLLVGSLRRFCSLDVGTLG
jgi:hypothetical protein